MFLIHLILVLLQNRGRSFPLVRLWKKTNRPVDVADNHAVAVWEVFLYLPSLSVLFLRRWSHSYRNRSDVRLCGSGRDCALHREDDTVRKRMFFFTSVCHYLLWLPVVLSKAGDLQKCVEAATLQSHLYILSLGRFFTLLHRETVVVNRWFTCFPYWHSCPTDWQCCFFWLVPDRHPCALIWF